MKLKQLCTLNNYEPGSAVKIQQEEPETEQKTKQENKNKLLIVVQRYGEDITGGSEAEARAYAEHLTPYYNVEVVTTCARDYITWANEYPEGDQVINGVLVHRFPVSRERDFKEFKRYCNRTRFSRHLFHIRSVEEKWIDLQGPYSPEAVTYIRENAHRYRRVIFCTYLYYLTVRCLAGNKPIPNAVLVPTAHDERSIRFGIYREVFAAPEAFIYNSPEEQSFVERRFKGTDDKPSVVAGCGIDEYEGELPEVRGEIRTP